MPSALLFGTLVWGLEPESDCGGCQPLDAVLAEYERKRSGDERRDFVCAASRWRRALPKDPILTTSENTRLLGRFFKGLPASRNARHKGLARFAV